MNTGTTTSGQDQEARREVRAHPLARSHHVYGHKAAMTLEVVQVARDSFRDSFATVQLEFATANGERFAWDRKHTFRLGRRELPLLAACLLGYVPGLTFAGHGPTHDKDLTVTDQGGNLYFKLRNGRAAVGVPMAGGDLVDCATRVMHALSLNAPGIDGQLLAVMVRRAGHIHVTAEETKQERRVA